MARRKRKRVLCQFVKVCSAEQHEGLIGVHNDHVDSLKVLHHSCAAIGGELAEIVLPIERMRKPVPPRAGKLITNLPLGGKPEYGASAGDGKVYANLTEAVGTTKLVLGSGHSGAIPPSPSLPVIW